jgi:O-glycosyl hydrolase
VLKNGTVAKRLYTHGNFSKFIRPGYTRVDISGAAPSGVELSAYKNPSDGTVVVVAINTGTLPVSVPIGIAGGTAPSQVTPWLTSANDDLASKAALPLSSSSFTATLDGKTVTTFVGK